ncbi:hypothetical protein ACKTEK_09805 [Tepidamorphus sp. 3E244]|uniref:hypothetical protein n=1 Tax=Tepidamorphus sp. 3E244 TaxID=3385498 RepID=UPI0038FC883F
MNARHLVRLCAAAALAGSFSSLAAAETAYNASGTGTAIDRSVVRQIGDNHLAIMHMAEYSEFKPDTADNPMAGLNGDCFGFIEVLGMSTQGNGFCQWTDIAGNGVTVRWEVDSLNQDGSTNGNWRFVAGTGPWEGVSGGGTYTVSMGEGQTRTNKITGAYVLPD